jgi:ABC exporter DevB family membrane fusion protein
VEPLSEDIKVGSEVSGKLRSVLLEEGDHVRRGQVLAILENDDFRAQVASAEADLAEKKAVLRKIVNGARNEERREALASVNEVQAVMENARAEMERRQRLYRDGVVSREEADRYEREFRVAKARHDAAAQHYALLEDPAREEDRARGEAGVALARAQLEEARARYEKTLVRSPIDGVVLRKHHRPGESVTNSSNSPDPVVTLGDEKVLRVRIDVDEDDVARVRLGDPAYVTADAYRGRKFWGHVVRIGREMGPKNLRTDEPTERVDKKILETLIQLDEGRELPVGLRVDSFILVSPSSGAPAPPRGR